MKLISSFVIALVAALATENADACSCVEESAAERLSSSRDVVLVQVISVVPETTKSQGPDGELVPGQRIVVKVLRVWKGRMPVGKTVTTSTVLDTGMCGRPARAEEKLLLYSLDADTLSFDHCSVVAERLVPEHIKELEALSNRSGQRPNKSLERTRER